MKIRSVVTLIGLTISFALPASAQQTNQPDPQLRERLISRIKAHTDALDKNDAAAVAANFTEDAVSVEQDGTSFGREAIQKVWADRFQKVHFSNNVATVDEDSPHVIGTDGKQMWPPELGARPLRATIGDPQKTKDSGQSFERDQIGISEC
jgi:SnoaL-like domain